MAPSSTSSSSSPSPAIAAAPPPPPSFLPPPPAWCCSSLSPPSSPSLHPTSPRSLPPKNRNLLILSPSSDQHNHIPSPLPSSNDLLPHHRKPHLPPKHSTSTYPQPPPPQQQLPNRKSELNPLESPPQPQPQQHHPQRRRRSKEKPPRDDIRTSWDLLKSGEVSNLIKQGFIEKTHNVSTFRRRLSPGRVSPLVDLASPDSTMSPAYSPFGKFNSVLNAGLHAASPPPPEKSKSSTLLHMLSHDSDSLPKPSASQAAQLPSGVPANKASPSMERSRSAREALSSSQPSGSSGCFFNDANSSDVKLTLRGKDGRSVSLDLHRHNLIERSEFFAARLSETWCKQQPASPYVLEIADCEDLEVYQETLQLLYCPELKCRLTKCSVSKVLGILKVAALILFEACIVSCLEHLEAVPWAEEEEEKVRAVLGQLQLDSFVAADVLRRIHAEDGSGSEEILVRLLQMVIKGKDDKARREMKTLVSRMLRENMAQNRDCVDLSSESLYRACSTCLDALLHLFLQASKTDFMNQGNEDRGTLVAQIARQADNLQWLLEILLDRYIADDFVKMWAHQSELASVHKQIATMLRFEVSRLTARLCVAIGKGQVLCPVDVRYMLLQTWLPPLVDDFGWMQRCCKGLDKKVVEDGISQTILTLPLKQQQSILLAWFDRFSNNGDDCPNLQKAFEVWWRRTFVRPCFEDCSQFCGSL